MHTHTRAHTHRNPPRRITGSLDQSTKASAPPAAASGSFKSEKWRQASAKLAKSRASQTTGEPLAEPVHLPMYGGAPGKPNAMAASTDIQKFEFVFEERLSVAEAEGVGDVIDNDGKEYPESIMTIEMPGGKDINVALVYPGGDNPNLPDGYTLQNLDPSVPRTTKTLTYMCNSSSKGGAGRDKKKGGRGNIAHKIKSGLDGDEGAKYVTVAWYAIKNIRMGEELKWPYPHSAKREGHGVELFKEDEWGRRILDKHATDDITRQPFCKKRGNNPHQLCLLSNRGPWLGAIGCERSSAVYADARSNSDDVITFNRPVQVRPPSLLREDTRLAPPRYKRRGHA